MIKRLRYLDEVTYLRIYDNGDNSEMRELENAHFISRVMALDILEKVRRWYKRHSDEEIEEYNRQIEEEHERLKPTQSTQPKRAPKPGVVYLIKSGKYCKIGETRSFSKRTRGITTQLPEPSKVLATIPSDDPVKLETYWHKRFAKKRMNGEWFDLTEADIAEFIDQI